MKKPSKNWPTGEARYIEITEVVTIHERMLNLGGGREGIRDFTLIHSAVERPKVSFAGKLLYTTIWLQAAALMQSLIKNHPFSDGNKRTGYFSTMRFLFINGIDLAAKHYQIIKFTLAVDVKKLNIEDIASWLKSHSNPLPT